jgi:dTDP-4-dehydrorhamnose 3,5-epimerase
VKVERTGIDNVFVVTPDVYGDSRGSFSETFNLERFTDATGIERSWVQDNESVSQRGVLRGLHFQNPRPQGKLVRCVVGAIFDVAVDLRRSSPSFSKWVGVELSSGNHKQLWVPEGFAHGFYTLTDSATVAYKTTDYYVASADSAIRWDDPQIGIDWPLDGEPAVSDKDHAAPYLIEADVFD